MFQVKVKEIYIIENIGEDYETILCIIIINIQN